MSGTKAQGRKVYREGTEKVTVILDKIKEENWTLGDFLYNLFYVPKDSAGKKTNSKSAAHTDGFRLAERVHKI